MLKNRHLHIAIVSILITYCVFFLPSMAYLSQAAAKSKVDDLYKKYNQLYTQGRYQEAIKYAKELIPAGEEAFGKNHPTVGVFLNNLALLYKSLGDYAKAEPLYKRSLAIDEKALGPEHPNVALFQNNLAFLYDVQGKYAEAEPLFKRSLAILEKALGPDHPQVAIVLRNIAVLHENRKGKRSGKAGSESKEYRGEKSGALI